MSVVRVLLATDEVSIVPDYAKQLFESPDWFGDDPAPVTRQLSAELAARGFQVEFTKLDETPESLAARARMGRIYHALCLLTIRVWRIGAALKAAIEPVRQLPDELLLENGVRVKCLPIIIANPMNLLGHAQGHSADLNWISKARWVSTQLRDEQPFETLVRGMADWQAELVAELEYCGYGVSVAADGRFEVYPYFQRTGAESPFFGRSSSVARLRRTGFLRLSKDAVEISDALHALEASLNEVRTLSGLAQEACLQECLERYPVLITQGLYETVWARKTLQSPDPLQRSIQPDFVMQAGSDWGAVLRPRILEIKTPEKQPMQGKAPSGFLLKALDQLMGRYQRYYDDARTQDEQRRIYGQVIERPTYALLVGRRLSPQREEQWHDAKARSEWQDVRLVSYDDLLDFARERVRLHQSVQFRLRTLLGS